MKTKDEHRTNKTPVATGESHGICNICNGRKTVPLFSWYDGKLNGSAKCWKCNGGTVIQLSLDDY